MMIGGGPPSSALEALTRIGAQDNDATDPIDLSDAALWLAKWAQPDLKLDAYRRHLDTLVQAARDYVADDLNDDALVVEAARQIIARRYGYAGATDPGEQDQAANLARTIDHRRGGAAVLAILYTHVLGALGRSVEILDFAPRPLISLQTRTGRIILDPFSGGRLLNARDMRRLVKDHHGERGEMTPDGLSAMDARAILLSLQHDIKVHHLRHGAPEAALHILEGALLIAPKQASLWRELGLLHARQDHLLDAIEALERFLQLPGGGAHRYTASQMVQQLRHRLDQDKP